jgi:hypothetical protein
LLSGDRNRLALSAKPDSNQITITNTDYQSITDANEIGKPIGNNIQNTDTNQVEKPTADELEHTDNDEIAKPDSNRDSITQPEPYENDITQPIQDKHNSSNQNPGTNEQILALGVCVYGSNSTLLRQDNGLGSGSRASPTNTASRFPLAFNSRTRPLLHNRCAVEHQQAAIRSRIQVNSS